MTLAAAVRAVRRPRPALFLTPRGASSGDVPFNIELKIEVWDSPPAGVVISAVRCANYSGGVEQPGSGSQPTPSCRRRFLAHAGGQTDRSQRQPYADHGKCSFATVRAGPAQAELAYEGLAVLAALLAHRPGPTTLEFKP
jgi:hypothetical protein